MNLRDTAIQRCIEDCSYTQSHGHAPYTEDRFWDKTDKGFTSLFTNIGDRDFQQGYYWDLLEDSDMKRTVFSYNETKSQVSRLRYSPSNNTWYGYQIHDKYIAAL